jgi:UTP--glucose-1-phosphate uridylyltransferase
MHTELELTAAQWQQLRRYGFNLETLTLLQARLRRGDFSPQKNWLQAELSPPGPDDITPWPTGTHKTHLQQLGEQTLQRGEVALVILNGGMATRFGHRVKGVCEVLGGLSFLGLKIKQLPHPMPVFLMNSFATHEATEQHLLEHQYFGVAKQQLNLLNQRISLRLNQDGSVFHGSHEQLSFYAPGHGDVFEVLAESAAFTDFVKNGGKTVMIANVDNVAATVDPTVLGSHITAQKEATVEVAARLPEDTGGAPIRVNGKLEIVEHFRLPPTFDYQALPVFNTNTLWLNVEAIKSNHPLTWFRADKIVEGHKVVQFERLMGEITAFVDTHFLEVPRFGKDNRFLPVKTPDDLPLAREFLRGLTALA